MFERLRNHVEMVLNQVGWNCDDISLVLPLGKSCQLPFIRQKIISFFPNSSNECESWFDLVWSKSKGAASYSYSRVQSSIQIKHDVDCLLDHFQSFLN